MLQFSYAYIQRYVGIFTAMSLRLKLYICVFFFIFFHLNNSITWISHKIKNGCEHIHLPAYLFQQYKEKRNDESSEFIMINHN